MDSRFHDLPADHFPLTMRAYTAMGVCVWEEVVESAPVAVYVPPLAKKHGPVQIEVEFATGEVQRAQGE